MPRLLGSDGALKDNLQSQEVTNKLIGRQGKSISELYPGGQIEIDGVRYDARSNLGKIAKGEKIEVVKKI